MMRRLSVALVLLACGLGVAVAARPEKEEAGGPYGGVWTARRSRWNVEGSGPTTLVQLQFETHHKGGHSSHSAPVPIGELAGLDASQVESSPGLVQFRLVRDAGTFALEGSFVRGEGAGHFTFAPSAAYRAELEKMGYGSPSDSEMFTLATEDVSRAFIRDLAGLGYAKLKLDDLMSMAIHGATPAFIRELRDLGYTGLAVDDLVSMRIHGARPEFIRELRGLGYGKLSVDDLVSMRIHGASPEYIRELKALGYAGVPVDDLVSMRIHGVTPEFVRSVNRRGQAATVEKLVEMRIHGDDEDQ
jgi:hypothetical protein